MDDRLERLIPYPVCNICGVEIDEGETNICNECTYWNADREE